MKIKCVETLEQGLPKGDGGMFKMSAGVEYPAQKTEHGYVVSLGGHTRTLSVDTVKKLADLKLIVIE